MSPPLPTDETQVRRPPPDVTAARPCPPDADHTILRGGGADTDHTAMRAHPSLADRYPMQAGDDPDADRTAMRAPADATRMRPGGPDNAALAHQHIPFGQCFKLRGRYELDEMIGQGAMGQVWRAKDLLGEEALDRNPYVAVKLLNSDFESRPDAFIALHREVTRKSAGHELGDFFFIPRGLGS